MPPFEAFSVPTGPEKMTRSRGIGNRRTANEVGRDIVAIHEDVARRGGRIVANYAIQNVAVVPSEVINVSQSTFHTEGDVLMLIAEFPESDLDKTR